MLFASINDFVFLSSAVIARSVLLCFSARTYDGWEARRAHVGGGGGILLESVAWPASFRVSFVKGLKIEIPGLGSFDV